MNKVSINDLKKSLAHWTERAAQGDSIEVTRYNRPYVRLVASEEAGLVRGKRVGQGALQSPFSKDVTRGAWWDTLEEDRRE
jgi:antitoxin (DNA-binding transcriptional repressor) of toxin-antitoxin stability system